MAKKPPLGVLPEYIWKRKRLEDLCRAIWEYEASGFSPLPEWREEAKRLKKEADYLRDYFRCYKKEATTMKVSYNGFAGELVKLERKEAHFGNTFHYDGTPYKEVCYDLSIYDSEKQVTHSFAGVRMEDVKFLGGAVSFDG